MKRNERPHNIGVLTDPYISEHQIRSLERACSELDINISLVIVNTPKDPDIAPEEKAKVVNEGIGIDSIRIFFEALTQEKAWTFVLAERKLAEAFGIGVESPTQVSISDVSLFDNATIRYVQPIKEGNWSQVPADVVNEVRKTCDVVIRYGWGLIKGDILEAPEYGVLSFHPADIRRYRGMGPPKVFLDNRNKIGLTLQRLNDDIDGGEIIAYSEQDITECTTLWEIYDKIEEEKETLLLQGLRNLRETPADIKVPDTLGSYHSIKLRRKPTFAGRILLKNLLGRRKK